MKKVFALFSVALIATLVLCSCGSKTDVAHDPNGFLGYSDSFWEWQMKQ